MSLQDGCVRREQRQAGKEVIYMAEKQSCGCGCQGKSKHQTKPKAKGTKKAK
jgi:hypothetical protein